MYQGSKLAANATSNSSTGLVIAGTVEPRKVYKDESDLEKILVGLVGVVNETMKPSHAFLWPSCFPSSGSKSS